MTNTIDSTMTVVGFFLLLLFIHYGDLYSAPSRLLLRSAPDPCTAKKKSFETRVECVRKNPGVQSLRQRKPIPHRGTNDRECTGLGCECRLPFTLIHGLSMSSVVVVIAVNVVCYCCREQWRPSPLSHDSYCIFPLISTQFINSPFFFFFFFFF